MASNIAELRREALADRVTGWIGAPMLDRQPPKGWASRVLADIREADEDEAREQARREEVPAWLADMRTAREAEIACEDWWKAERQELRRQFYAANPAPVNREPYPAHIDMYEHLAGRSGVVYRGD